MHQLSSVHLASAYTLEFVKKQYKKKIQTVQNLRKNTDDEQSRNICTRRDLTIS